MSDRAAPKGFEFVYNPITGCDVLHPIIGFSEKYLTTKSFIPSSTTNIATSISGKNNSNLHAAKVNKNDEFYTTLKDITRELGHYSEHFKDKIVYCPCDKVFNLGRSNFAEYFISMFHNLGIKKLICTQFNPNGCGEMKVVDFSNHGFKWEYNGEYPDGGEIDESMIDTTILKGNGSFDSDECQEIMMGCDIVSTNPPFSRFREFLSQIVRFEKKFLIIGNLNAITYKEVFPLIKNNKVWLGMTNVQTFIQPDGTEKKFGNIGWFTNLEHNKRVDGIYLSKTYVESEYPKYENYDAIEVSKARNIPIDYDGVMGVPISFLEHYNPEQFEIVGCADANELPSGWSGMSKEFVDLYYEQGNTGSYKAGNRLACFIDGGNAKVPYKRILIRHRKNI